MLARRIIPCLDVRDGRVVKGTQFRNHVDVGDILDLALRYQEQGADELVFYDITASTDTRAVCLDWIRAVSRLLDIPFCVAGGIETVELAGTRLAAGADKISINTPALRNPELINAINEAYGQQCVVIGIDSFTDNQGAYQVRSHTGDADKMRETGRNTLSWVKEVIARGAGEIVLNCMNQDGMRQGYDITQLQSIRQICTIPLIASGGAGNITHFKDLFQNTSVDGALAASVFHTSTVHIQDLKRHLKQANIEIRV